MSQSESPSRVFRMILTRVCVCDTLYLLLLYVPRSTRTLDEYVFTSIEIEGKTEIKYVFDIVFQFKLSSIVAKENSIVNSDKPLEIVQLFYCVIFSIFATNVEVVWSDTILCGAIASYCLNTYLWNNKSEHVVIAKTIRRIVGRVLYGNGRVKMYARSLSS